MDSKQTRIEWIDMAKGYGMFLVILGHCFNKDTLIHNWVFSFHMPMFFLLSGLVFRYEKYQSLMELLKDKSKTLLIPYFYFSAAGLLVSVVIPEWRQDITIEGILTDIYCGYPKLTHITSTWYLMALFIISAVFYVILWLTDKLRCKALPYILIIISGIMGYGITIIKRLFFDQTVYKNASSGFSLPGGRLPLTIDTCLTAICFFAVGYWLKKVLILNRSSKIDLRKKPLLWGTVLLLVQTVVAIGLNTRVNLHGCTYGNGIYFYIAAFAGSFAVFLFCIGVTEKEESKAIRECLVTALVRWGKNSLFILGMQSLLVNVYIYMINCFKHTAYVLYETVPFEYGMIGFLAITFILIPISLKVKNIIKD